MTGDGAARAINDDLPRALLAAAGLDVPPDELAELCSMYPDVRIQVDRLYAPEFADADPYLVPTIRREKTT
jgi:hypothetical protein